MRANATIVVMNNNTVARNLLSVLINLQYDLKLSNTAFAAKLGINRQLWQMTKSGIRPIHLTILKAVVRNFPQLIPDVIVHMSIRDDHETN
ncbi:hypothetical protein DEHALATV1_0097 [Dehalococcoides mccartyi]|uniref:XRE family transcriptional regulator n=1 Tax=Dehalococcoides mccartyi TaxID=61435 RepID=A0AB33HPY7_9CHLR|nr:hypothetical protein IBK_0125 [Dehalococcoides mccartyi IBARAKI]BAZ96725.1 hypothetical protein DEHALATV1_0097 [Dehalococcoides mccartyi]